MSIDVTKVGYFYNGGLSGNFSFFVASNWNVVPGYIKNVYTHHESFSCKKRVIKKLSPKSLWQTYMKWTVDSVLKDPALFPEPDAFKPEKILDKDGDLVVIPDEFIPFSKGSRSCPGESLARLELFLYINTLSQKFQFHCPDGQSLPEVKGILGLTYKPKPYEVEIVPRKVWNNY